MKQSFENSPYKYLLADKKVRAWIENAERGSVITASEYFRRLGRICKDLSTTPNSIAQLNEKTAADFLQEAVSHLEKSGLAGSAIAGYVKTVKSWLAFNDVMVRRKMKIEDASDYKKYENETIPTREELERILNAADLRARTGISLMAFSGCRVEVLGSFLGDDGLKFADFPEINVKEGNAIEFSKVPTLIKVRKPLSKSGKPYLTFLPEQGCTYLKEYIEHRMNILHEKVEPDSPIITATPRNPGKMGDHIRTANVGDMIRNAIRAAGFMWRPYVLRRVFDTRMMQAEADGLIIRDWRQYWMGHQGDIEHTYTVNKGLPEDVIEEMRKSFLKAASKYLVTKRKPGAVTEEQDIKQAFKEQMLAMVGFPKEEIEMMDFDKLSDEDMQKMVREKLLGAMANVADPDSLRTPHAGGFGVKGVQA